MAIVQLDKMTLYGAESQKESVIQLLQQHGCAHLVNLGSSDEDFGAADASSEARDALKYLRACPEQRRQVRRAKGFDREDIVATALRLKREELELEEEHDELRKAITDLRPWGEFRLPSDGAVGNVKFWFYVVPLRDVSKAGEICATAREVSRDHQHAYFLVLGSEEPNEFPGTRVQLDARPMSQLRSRLEEVEEELEDLRHQRVGLTRWCDLLESALDEAADTAAQNLAARQTFDGNNVYALQGWIPRAASDHMRRFAAEHDLAISIQPPSPDEEPPTLLENPERVAGSEMLVTFYKTPEYRSWDPSVLVGISFAIFFAMIFADAGYGLVLMLITAYFWRKMGATRGGRRTRSLLTLIFGSTVIYGVLCGSYFGVSPSGDSLLGKLNIINAQSQSLMMPLTIAIGVIHISLANLITAWHQRDRATALAPLGWVLVMIGATLAGIGAMADVGENASVWLTRAGTIPLVGGLVAVFLFSSQRPFFSSSLKNHLLRVVDGFKGLTGISGLFGDVLSYLRLFALGLSGSKLSATFNNLGASAWDEAGFGVILAIAIVVLGHTLNLVLCIMSGVVHGLRLNCIEFFKWGLPEEGYSFQAFAKKARQR